MKSAQGWLWGQEDPHLHHMATKRGRAGLPGQGVPAPCTAGTVTQSRHKATSGPTQPPKHAVGWPRPVSPWSAHILGLLARRDWLGGGVRQIQGQSQVTHTAALSPTPMPLVHSSQHGQALLSRAWCPDLGPVRVPLGWLEMSEA